MYAALQHGYSTLEASKAFTKIGMKGVGRSMRLGNGSVLYCYHRRKRKFEHGNEYSLNGLEFSLSELVDSVST